jgi:site-specific recombinase XerD
MYLRIHGKRGKIRFVPIHPMALRLIEEYLQAGKHGGGQVHKSLDEALFRPVKNNRTSISTISSLDGRTRPLNDD